MERRPALNIAEGSVGFIPKGARWYLADLVLEHQIDGEPQNVVHVNTHLIEASSPEQAYDKAMSLGRRAESTYENSDGGQVRVLFRGLRELNVIHEDLEDGAELMYSEVVGVPEGELREWCKSKEQLGIFAPIEDKQGLPNYVPEVFKGLAEESSGGNLPT